MTGPPAAVRDLAERRAAARAARDFAESDRLREQIAAAGWAVRDTPAGPELAELPAYDVGPLPDRSAEPDQRRCTVGIVVDGWADDVRTCVQALLEHAPPDVVVALLDNGSDAGAAVHELAADSRVHEWHLAEPAGWSDAVTALLRAEPAAVHVLLDPSTVLLGDALTPVLAGLDDPSVVGAGWRGVRVQDGWREFEDAPPGEVEALLGYLFAVRRRAALAVPLPRSRYYRNADIEWSFLLREAGGRLVVPAVELPLRQDRHRGYHETDPAYRDKQSRTTYDRFLTRFRGREQLRLPR